MLVSAQVARSSTVESSTVDRLTRLWTERYSPNLSSLSTARNLWVLGDLVEAALPEGRATTVTKLHESLDDFSCQTEGRQAKLLHDYMPSVLSLPEAQQLTDCAFQIYMRLLKLYQQSASIEISPMHKLWAVTSHTSPSVWGIADIAALAETLEPMLLELQKQLVASMDWRMLGFMTTPLNFTNKLLLQHLTDVEQVLIAPYFKFVEEQAALPWQRVCTAAARHTLDSPLFILVEQMMPVSSEIAWTVYRQLASLFPKHYSRSGQLHHPDVVYACLRDLEMFQSYLWLCVLEDNLQPIKQELITLCVMVMESVEVRWDLIAQWNQLLLDEIVRRITLEQRFLLQPYLAEIQQAFHIKRSHLGIAV